MRQKREAKPKMAVPDGMIEFLKIGKVADGDLGTFLDKGDTEKLAAAWSAIGEDIIAEHVKRSPGSRPWGWWRFSAPRMRRRVGGRGTLRSVIFKGWKAMMDFGLPGNISAWINKRDVELGICAVPFDENDPPTFESQASFLRRLGLLLPGEEKRIQKAAWEPEAIAP